MPLTTYAGDDSEERESRQEIIRRWAEAPGPPFNLRLALALEHTRHTEAKQAAANAREDIRRALAGEVGTRPTETVTREQYDETQAVIRSQNRAFRDAGLAARPDIYYLPGQRALFVPENHQGMIETDGDLDHG